VSTAVKERTLPIKQESDVVMVRHAVRDFASALKFGIVDQTKLITAASELARNTLIHGGGGTAIVQTLTSDSGRDGLRVIFEDNGPGISDVSLALKDGFTTGGGLGLGLGGAKRLVNEFDIQSKVGKGTRVTITRWR
jgi:serine/threonine-protein kinase RsbT